MYLFYIYIAYIIRFINLGSFNKKMADKGQHFLTGWYKRTVHILLSIMRSPAKHYHMVCLPAWCFRQRWRCSFVGLFLRDCSVIVRVCLSWHCTWWADGDRDVRALCEVMQLWLSMCVGDSVCSLSEKGFGRIQECCLGCSSNAVTQSNKFNLTSSPQLSHSTWGQIGSQIYACWKDCVCIQICL